MYPVGERKNKHRETAHKKLKLRNEKRYTGIPIRMLFHKYTQISNLKCLISVLIIFTSGKRHVLECTVYICDLNANINIKIVPIPDFVRSAFPSAPILYRSLCNAAIDKIQFIELKPICLF